MKIFCGVQGTGNGHITRARMLAQKFRSRGISVDWMFTGRPKDLFFEMEIFGDWRWRKGLTFASHHGNVDYLRTLAGNDLPGFVRDIRNLDLKDYDLVITDFEPVTAWAAKRRGIKTIGIGHQYAFSQDIPIAGRDPLGRFILKNFAPADVRLGIHWHHFNGPIIPPVIETQMDSSMRLAEKIIVYLPFENIHDILALLKPFTSHSFHVYHPEAMNGPMNPPPHVQLKPLSRSGFQDDFRDCGGVICNAGVELPSETMHMGKKLMVKPLLGQVEQRSNALALGKLGLAQVMDSLDSAHIAQWLHEETSQQLKFPDVAEFVVDWLMTQPGHVDESWARSIWTHCK